MGQTNMTFIDIRWKVEAAGISQCIADHHETRDAEWTLVKEDMRLPLCAACYGLMFENRMLPAQSSDDTKGSDTQ